MASRNTLEKITLTSFIYRKVSFHFNKKLYLLIFIPLLFTIFLLLGVSKSRLNEEEEGYSAALDTVNWFQNTVKNSQMSTTVLKNKGLPYEHLFFSYENTNDKLFSNLKNEAELKEDKSITKEILNGLSEIYFSSPIKNNLFCYFKPDQNESLENFELYLTKKISTQKTFNIRKPYLAYYEFFSKAMQRTNEEILRNSFKIKNKIRRIEEESFFDKMPYMLIIYYFFSAFFLNIPNTLNQTYSQIYKSHTNKFFSFHGISFKLQIFSYTLFTAILNIFWPVFFISLYYLFWQSTVTELVFLTLTTLIIFHSHSVYGVCINSVLNFDYEKSWYMNYFLGFIPYVLTWFLEKLRIKEIVDLTVLLYVFPYYSFFYYFFAYSEFKSKAGKDASFGSLLKFKSSEGIYLVIPVIINLFSQLIVLFLTDSYLSNRLFYHIQKITSFFGKNRKLSTKKSKEADNQTLVIKNLSKTYDSLFSSFQALNNVSFEVKKGEKIALLGPNGCGKTTLFECLIGFEKISSGQVFYRGRDLGKIRNKIKIGYCPQLSYFIDALTVEENIDIIGEIYDIPKDSLYKDMGELDLMGIMNQPVDKCSGGQKRKLSFLLSVVFKPEIVFLDEPTTGVDPLSKKVMKKILTKYCDKSMVFISSHLIDDIEGFSNKIIIIKDGTKEIFGTQEQIMDHYKLNGIKVVMNLKNPADLDEIVSEIENNTSLKPEVESIKSNKIILGIKIENEEDLYKLAVFFERDSLKTMVDSYSFEKTQIEEVFKLASFKNEKDSSVKKKKELSNFSYLVKPEKRSPKILGIIYQTYLRYKYNFNLFFSLLFTIIWTSIRMNELFDVKILEEISPSILKGKKININCNMEDSLFKELENFMKKNYQNISLANIENEETFKTINISTKELVLKEEDSGITVYNKEISPLNFVINGILINFSKWKEDENTFKKIDFKFFFNKRIENSLNPTYENIILFFNFFYYFLLFNLFEAFAQIVVDQATLNKEFRFGLPIYFCFFLNFLAAFIFQFIFFLIPFLIVMVKCGSRGMIEKFRIFLALFVVSFSIQSFYIIIMMFLNTYFILLLKSIIIASIAGGGQIGIFSALNIVGKIFQNSPLAFLIYFFKGLNYIDPLNNSRNVKYIFSNFHLNLYKLNIFCKFNLIYYLSFLNSVVYQIIAFIIIRGINQSIGKYISSFFNSRRIRELKKKSKKKFSNLSSSKKDEIAMEFDNVIKFYNQSFFSYSPALKGVSFVLPKSCSYAILGPNGGGKTSAFKTALGEILPDSGKVLVNGKKVGFMKSSKISYVPQFEKFDSSSTPEEIIIGYSMLSGWNYSGAKKVCDELVHLVNLQKHKNKLFGNLSGGNKRKVAIAVSLVKNENLFILDEPTTGIDITSSIDIWKAVHGVISQGSSVIMASHSMKETSELAHKIIILIKGEIFDIDSIESLRAKYGERFRISFEFKEMMKIEGDFKELLFSHFGMFEHFVEESTHLNILVARKGLKLSEMIRKISNAKEKLKIKKFFVEYEGLDDILTTILKNEENNYSG